MSGYCEDSNKCSASVRGLLRNDGLLKEDSAQFNQLQGKSL
jgi:hypothetical protein